MKKTLLLLLITIAPILYSSNTMAQSLKNDSVLYQYTVTFVNSIYNETFVMAYGEGLMMCCLIKAQYGISPTEYRKTKNFNQSIY